jgi:IS605 OrfB family transposase
VDLHNQGKLDEEKSNRDGVRKYGYEYIPLGETDGVNFIYQHIVKREDPSFFYIPDWLEKRPHNRVIRGALKKFESNLKSAKTNCSRGNTKHFEMHFRSRKKNDYVSFEDSSFPAIYKKLEGYYGYRTNDKKRVSITPQDVAADVGWSGITITHDKETDQYHLLFPVPVNYFPSKDRRCENQTMSPTGKTIALDPGMRKFLVGYCPDDNHVLIVDRGKKITRMLLDIDKANNDEERDNKEIYSKWQKIKNYINELHWRTIRYLVKHYDTIILGDINTKSILQGNIPKIVKRVLQQYSFCSFKTKLNWVCSLLGKKLFLVDERLTSKSCCKCGYKNNVESSERYVCSQCNLSLDRDINGAVNILLKALTIIL